MEGQDFLDGFPRAVIQPECDASLCLHLAPPEFRPVALKNRYVDMNMLPPEALDDKRALVALPPLIKGYLRLGGYVGDGAVVDHQFGTTDVSVIVVTDRVTGKYIKHYTRSETGGTGSPADGL